MNLILVYALVFVAALLTVDALLRLIFRSRRSSHEINSRLRHLKTAKNQVSAYQSMLKKRGIRESVEDVFSGGRITRMYRQSGIEMEPPKRIAMLILLFLAGWLIGAVLLHLNIVLQIGFAFVFAIATAATYVYIHRRRRIRTFVGQLADAIDIVVRSLQAGHPLNAAIALVAKEMPDPIGSEFGILSDQLSFGEDLPAGMLNLYDRVGANELKLLAVTVTVQRTTGGNLAEILENLATMIRDRIMLQAKIRAISAEGRMTAVVMAVFPFGLFLMIRTMVPTYFDPLIETGWAPTVVAICLTVMVIGIVILNRMVNFDY